MSNDAVPPESDQVTNAETARSHHQGGIHPAGMSYERALHIAVEVLEKSVARVDWFAADGVYQTPKIWGGRFLGHRVNRKP